MDQGTARRTTPAYSFTLEWRREAGEYVGELTYFSPGLMQPKAPGAPPAMMMYHGPEAFRGRTRVDLFTAVTARMIELGGEDTIGPDDFEEE